MLSLIRFRRRRPILPTPLPVPENAPPGRSTAASDRPSAPCQTSGHRQKVLATAIVHSRLCPRRRADRLAVAGLVDCGDLLDADLDRIAESFQSPRRARWQLRMYRRAVRLSLGVEGLSPADALLLVAIHRRTPASLARCSASELMADIRRFAETTVGRNLIGNRRLPGPKRIGRWMRSATADAVAHPGLAD